MKTKESRISVLGPWTRRGAWLGVLLLAAPLSAAAPPGAGPEQGPERSGRLRGVLKQLDLSEAQRKELRAERESRKATVKPLRATLRQGREELDALWRAESPDRGAIEAKRRELADLRQQLDAHRDEGRLALYRVLTPEQRRRFDDLMAAKRPPRKR